MPSLEAPVVELGSAPRTPSVAATSPTPSEVSSASSPEPHNLRATPLFRALAMPPPEPEQPPGQDELERRLPGYRRIVIPRDLTLIELLKQYSGVTSDDEVLRIREAKLRVVAERVGLRRLHVLAPRLRSLTLDGSALSSLRDLGVDLVHLKILSVNRCGLTCLDGVWGLGALRELHAAGNRLQDLHPLAALQKLHTLNLADNPIEESTRLWTLGVCGALRSLTLRGTSVSDHPDYRVRVASALPMLTSLDDRPLNADEESEDILDDASSSSDSDVGELAPTSPRADLPPTECGPGTSSSLQSIPEQGPAGDMDRLAAAEATLKLRRLRRRPATTEGAGVRPPRPHVPPRPRTALDRPTIDAPTRLQILNTLMDEEWRCSGSKLTSRGAVCGNLARALRRPSSAYGPVRRRYPETDAPVSEMIEETMEEASRALAAEIPRVPRVEEWAKFRADTGIDINIDFNERPVGADALSAIERLERIEKETFERLKLGQQLDIRPAPPPTAFGCAMTIMSDFSEWRDMDLVVPDPQGGIDALFKNIGLTRCNEESSTDE